MSMAAETKIINAERDALEKHTKWAMLLEMYMNDANVSLGKRLRSDWSRLLILNGHSSSSCS